MQIKHLTKFNIHVWLKKSLTKVSIAGTHLNIIHAICDNIILNGEKLRLPAQIWNNARMPTLNSIQHSIGKSATAITWEKEIKGIKIEREEVKFSLCADGMIVYIENPKDNLTKAPRTGKFSKAAGYKINIQKLDVLFTSNNEVSEKECKKIITFKSYCKN